MRIRIQLRTVSLWWGFGSRSSLLCGSRCSLSLWCGSGSSLSLWSGAGSYLLIWCGSRSSLSLWCGCGSGSYLSTWSGSGSSLSLWCGSGSYLSIWCGCPDQQHWFNVPLGVDVGKVAWLSGEGLLDASLLEQEGGVVADDRPGNVGWNHLYTWKNIKKM